MTATLFATEYVAIGYGVAMPCDYSLRIMLRRARAGGAENDELIGRCS